MGKDIVPDQKLGRNGYVSPEREGELFRTRNWVGTAMSLPKGKGNCSGPEIGSERLGLSRQGIGIVPDQKLGRNDMVPPDRERKLFRTRNWVGTARPLPPGKAELFRTRNWVGTARSLPSEKGNCVGPDIGSERSGPSRQEKEIVPDQKLGRNG